MAYEWGSVPPAAPAPSTAALSSSLSTPENARRDEAKVSINLSETGEVRLEISLNIPGKEEASGGNGIAHGHGSGDPSQRDGGGAEQGSEELLSVDVVTIPHSGRTVHLVGTAHVSKKSCEDVAVIMQRIKPQMVAVELCPSRAVMLKELPPEDLSFSAVLKSLSQPNVNVFEVLYGWYLGTVASSLEVSPGSEFRVAYKAAQQQQPKAHVVLVDRPVHVTVARMWGGLSPWEKVRLAWRLVYDCLNFRADEVSELIENMKGTDALAEALADVGEQFPGLLTPLMEERDLYMSHKLRMHAGRMKEGEHMVAVVGAGHVKGIREHWGEETDIDAIMETPPSTPFPLHLKALLVLGGVGGAALAVVAGGAVVVGAWRGVVYVGGRAMGR